jgi:hypothetical protein
MMADRAAVFLPDFPSIGVLYYEARECEEDSVRILRVLSPIVLLLGAVAGCGSEELQSLARDRDITIDGDIRDWQGALQFLEDADLSYGLVNDRQAMYIVLVVGDREVRRQIIMSGMYMWFDPTGEKNKRFGLRFPIGLQEDVTDMMPMMQQQDPSQFQEKFEASAKEMMVIGVHDSDWRRTGVRDVGGIEAAAIADENKLVLEFKVPVTNDGQYGYGIGAYAGSVIGLGIETPEIDFEEMREQMRTAKGGRGGGGRGGWGGGGGGRGGGAPGGTRPSGGQRPERPDPIKVWTTVHLAGGDARS